MCMSMCMCMCICMSMCMGTCMCMCMSMCMRACEHVHVQRMHSTTSYTHQVILSMAKDPAVSRIERNCYGTVALA